MSWLQKLMPAGIRTQGGSKRNVPEGLWGKCEGCGAVLYQPELERSLKVCPKCGHHMPIGARERLKQFLDEGTGVEIAGELEAVDALKFRDSKKYKDRLVASQKNTGEKDARSLIRETSSGFALTRNLARMFVYPLGTSVAKPRKPRRSRSPSNSDSSSSISMPRTAA